MKTDDNKVEVVLLFPPGSDMMPKFEHCLGPAYVIAYLRANGIRAMQFVSDNPMSVRECVRQVLSRRPGIVGFTVFRTNYLSSCLIAQTLKKESPDTVTVFGGPMPTLVSEEILRDTSAVDICVRGEGEEVLLQLIRRLKKPFSSTRDVTLETLGTIKGITLRDGDRVVSTPDSRILLSGKQRGLDLDCYPSPYLTGVIPPEQAVSVGMISARGCNQNCTYCNCAVLSKKRVFFHSVDRVLAELAYLNQSSAFEGPVMIQDDAFTLFPERAEAICRGILENNLRIPLSALTRPDCVTEDLLRLMKQAGFRNVGFSLESASPRVLRLIGKVRPPQTTKDPDFIKEKEYIEKLRHYVGVCRSLGFRDVYVSIMVGLPGESLKEARSTVDFVEALNVDFYDHNRLIIYPGCPIYEHHARYGFKLRPKRVVRVLPATVHPIPVREIKPGPRSRLLRVWNRNDAMNTRCMALYTGEDLCLDGFRNLILISDLIPEGFLAWLQKTLCVNGRLIQIFSDRDHFLAAIQETCASLEEEFVPSTVFEPYFFERDRKVQMTALVPGRMLVEQDDRSGNRIFFERTEIALRQGGQENRSVKMLVCTAPSEEDARRLVEWLMEIDQAEDPFFKLAQSGHKTLFEGLCKWMGPCANCMTFETAFLDPEGWIRICRHGEPFKITTRNRNGIQKALHDRRREAMKKRGCASCPVENSCAKCLFPYPLNEDQYCRYRREFGTHPVAQIVKNFQG